MKSLGVVIFDAVVEILTNEIYWLCIVSFSIGLATAYIDSPLIPIGGGFVIGFYSEKLNNRRAGNGNTTHL